MLLLYPVVLFSSEGGRIVTRGREVKASLCGIRSGAVVLNFAGAGRSFLRFVNPVERAGGRRRGKRRSGQERGGNEKTHRPKILSSYYLV